jgi:uncharacterized membrane protein
MLVAVPIGLWIFALVCDIAAVAGGSPAWSTTALYCAAAGVVGAVLAAIPGLIDYFSIDEAAMKRIATWHLGVNLAAVLIFAVGVWARLRIEMAGALPLVLSVCGVALIGCGGWLGGEMVYVKGMAVEAVEKLAAEKQASKRRAA